MKYGLGLRPPHYHHVLTQKPKVDYFEVISENFMGTGGRPRRILEEVRQDYPIALHGVSLNIGSTDPLNEDYLSELKTLIDWVDPAWVSDHICFTGVGGETSHDLLPVSFNEETLAHLTQRIRQVQDTLQRPLAFENPSTYLQFKTSDIPEPEFLSELVAATGCELLLDVNNVYVSSFNLGFDPKVYLEAIPTQAIRQIHLAGFQDNGDHLIDTHDHPVYPQVWELYELTRKLHPGDYGVMVEWDAQLPEFDVLMAELEKARALG